MNVVSSLWLVVAACSSGAMGVGQGLAEPKGLDLPLRPAKEKDDLEAISRDKRLRAMKALEAGEVELAERLYEELIDLNPNDPFEHIHLARMFDRLGENRKAYNEYAIVLRGSPKAVSTLQQDARVLSRYGDLCRIMGKDRDAMAAYSKAFTSPDNYLRSNGVRVAPANRTIQGLSAAAHVVAGTKNQATGKWEEALKEYDLAIQEQPKWWVGWYYRAEQRALRSSLRDSAKGDFAKAESLALGEDKEIVRRSKALHGIE